MSAHIEVESELNPRFKETGRWQDYMGIYHVVRYDGDQRTVLKTFDDPFTDRRGDAYRYAGMLLNSPTAPLPKGRED